MESAPHFPLASVDASQMQPRYQFWRVQGVPPQLSKPELVEALRHHPDMCFTEDTVSDEDGGDDCSTNSNNWILTLASDESDISGNMVATIRIPEVSPPFFTPELDFQLAINVPALSSEVNMVQAGMKRKRDSFSHSVGLRVDRHFQGITTLFGPSDDQHKIDILAVSGLGNHAFSSFVNKEDGHMWLLDSIPQDLPQARIMIYGYEEGSQESADPEDHLRSLQAALIQLLQSNKKRPLVLIGHSLGGLFIKEALIRIANSKPDLMVRVRGLLLFSVPNEGVDIESFSSTLRDPQTCSLFECMKVLRPPVLQLQGQNFAQILPQSNIEMFCFCETKPCPIAMQAREPLGVLRENTSAWTSSWDLANETSCTTSPPKCLVSWRSATSCLPAGASPDRSLSIDRSHWDMVKFFSHDVEYEKVAHVLKRIAMQLVDSTQLNVGYVGQRPSQEQQRCLRDSLNFHQTEIRQTAAHNAYPNTGAWLLEKSEYLEWLDPSKFDQHHGLLWIAGKPGAGKSTLMRSVLANAKKKMKKKVIISYFFNAFGNELERSFLGMYRSLLFQLLERLPGLYSVFNSLNPTIQNIRDHVWTIESLKMLLDRAVRRIGNSAVTFFIDALGECDEAQIQDTISFFASLGHAAVSEKFDFRICFSSRHYQHSMQNALRLSLEEQEGHREDAFKYLNAKLNIGRSPIAEQVQSEFREKPVGVFLWTFLVVRFLNKQYNAGRVYTLRHVLRELPDDLHDLYCKLLTYDSSNRLELLLCIQLMLFAKQPLDPEQLCFAIISGTMPEALATSHPTVKAIVSEQFIPDCSKGFVEVSKSDPPVVLFVHESVREFFLKSYGVREIWPDYGDNFEGRSHEQLKRCCYNHVTFNVSEQLGLMTSFTSAHRVQIDSSFPFMKYAIGNILYHAERAQGYGIDQEMFLRSFPLDNWITINNMFEQDEARRYTNKARLLYILAEKDLPGLIRCQPSVLSYLHPDAERYGTPLFAALARRSDKALSAFFKAEVESAGWGSAHRWLLSNMDLQQGKILSAIGDDFKFSEEKGVTSYLTEPANRPLFNLLLDLGKIEVRAAALIEAAKNGNEELVGWLLKTNIELTNGEGKEALLWAAMNGHATIVQILLRAPGNSTDLRDQHGRTPLSWGAGNGHEAVVKLLLDRGTDVNSQDGTSQTPLGWAAGNGHVAIVDLLLDASANINSEDHTGLNPLRWAARNGHKDAVKMLLTFPGINVNIKDKIGCEILLIGEGHGYEAVVELLLDQQSDVNSATETGQTPLIWAVTNEHKIAVRMLLAVPGIDINVKDKDGRTPISWAASNGHEAIVKLLLDRKVNANLTDNSGQTPLTWAVKNSKVNVVNILLHRVGVLVDLKDNTGRSPLSWAGESCEEILALFLDAESIDLNSRDDHGRSPLSYATERGNERIVQRLLKTPGVEVCSVDSSGWTPLFWACTRWPIAQLLVEMDEFDLDLRDNSGRTLLSWAAAMGAVDLAQLLLTKGVNVNCRDESGRTPLSWATESITSTMSSSPLSTLASSHRREEDSNPERRGTSTQAIATQTVPTIVIAHNGNHAMQDYQMQLNLLEIQNKKRLLEARQLNESLEHSPSTILRDVAPDHEVIGPMVMFAGNASRIISLFLADGRVDPDCRDYNGRSPLSYAAEQGHSIAVSKLLATKKVDLSFRDKTGQTPICYARSSQNQYIVHLLSMERSVVFNNIDN